MSDAQGTPLIFGRAARTQSTLPNLAPDLCRSYQWPFHLRVHPDVWELGALDWQLCVERVGLRPGVGGVGGKHGSLDSITDLGLLNDWSKVGDRRWVIVASGDPRLAGLYPGGNFLRSVRVSSAGRDGNIIVGAWERVTEDGQVVDDPTERLQLSSTLAADVLALDGPTSAARAKVVTKLRGLLNQLQSSASSSRVPGGTVQLKKRIHRVASLLVRATGDEGYLLGVEDPSAVPERRASRRVPRPATPPTHADLASFVSSLSTSDRARLLVELGAADAK